MLLHELCALAWRDVQVTTRKSLVTVLAYLHPDREEGSEHEERA